LQVSFRALAGDLPFQRRRDQNVHRGGPEGVFIDLLGARETGNLLFLRLPGGEGGHINPAFVIQGGGVILNHHDTRADAGEQAGRFATDVTKALQRHFGAFNFDTGATATSRPVTNTPRPVAFSRPREPPRWIGLPVTTPVMVVPWFME
jgi:hypothetical protein